MPEPMQAGPQATHETHQPNVDEHTATPQPADVDKLATLSSSPSGVHGHATCPDPHAERVGEIGLRLLGTILGLDERKANPIVVETLPTKPKGHKSFRGTTRLDLSQIATGNPRYASLAEAMTATITLEVHGDLSTRVSLSYKFADKDAEALRHSPLIWISIKQRIWTTIPMLSSALWGSAASCGGAP